SKDLGAASGGTIGARARYEQTWSCAGGRRYCKDWSRDVRALGPCNAVQHGVSVTDTLTESFCERCGTRFSFTAPPKPKPLGRLRTIGRGLATYVMSDGSSLSTA